MEISKINQLWEVLILRDYDPMHKEICSWNEKIYQGTSTIYNR